MEFRFLKAVLRSYYLRSAKRLGVDILRPIVSGFNQTEYLRFLLDKSCPKNVDLPGHLVVHFQGLAKIVCPLSSHYYGKSVHRLNS